MSLTPKRMYPPSASRRAIRSPSTVMAWLALR